MSDSVYEVKLKMKIDINKTNHQLYDLGIMLSKWETQYQSYVLANLDTGEVWLGLICQEELEYIKRKYQVKNKAASVFFSRSNKEIMKNRPGITIDRAKSFSVRDKLEIDNYFLGWAIIEDRHPNSVIYNDDIDESLSKLVSIFP
jgi:hypothetical protein